MECRIIFNFLTVPFFGTSIGHSAQMMLGCWLIGVVLIKTYYVAEITSMVAIPSHVYAFESIEDVASQSHRVTVLVAKGSTCVFFF